MKQNYLVVIEKGGNNYSAFSPDVPGCASTGKTVEETLENMREALEFHLQGTVESGEEAPTPKGLSYYLEQTEDISEEDIIAHLTIETPETVAA
jgi:predicted RNase H-like HicB family nuclease